MNSHHLCIELWKIVKKGALLVKVRMLLQWWFKPEVAEVEEGEHWTSYERQQGFFIHSDTAVEITFNIGVQVWQLN